MSGTKLQRHPVAFGITYWGPLPDTRETFIQWDGPGSGLYLYASNPEYARDVGLRIRHRLASGEYRTLRDAERAVRAFVAAGQG
jgi:hypothetical protein